MNTAFDLEQRILSWREAMMDEGLTDTANLDELENHLREHFAQSTKAGAAAEAAFESALVSLGEVVGLRREFAKRANQLKFHWDNPLALHVLSAWFFFWGLSAGWSALTGVWRSQQLPLLTIIYVLWIGAGLGLLCRRNFWRWYALATSAFSCVLGGLGGKAAYEFFRGDQHSYIFYHSIFPQTTLFQYALLYVAGLFNITFSAWAVYILTCKSIRRLFSITATVELPA